VIHGLDAARDWRNGVIFHGGTARRDGDIVTSGGRVLGVTALGDTVRAAVGEAYGMVDRLRWDGMHYRRDIAYRAVEDNR